MHVSERNRERENNCASSSARSQFCAVCDVRERSICADLSTRELEQVQRIMAHRSAPKGRAILQEGEPNDALYIVVSGSFRLTKHLPDGRRQVTGFLFKGDFCGIMACAASAYSAEALEDSEVCRFPHAYLDEIARNSPGVKDRLIARGQTEYHKAQDHIVLLGRKSAEERVASFIEMIGAIASPGNPEASIIPLSMPRQDIADYLGLRLETLSRTLAMLKEKGALAEISRRRLVKTPGADAIIASLGSAGGKPENF